MSSLSENETAYVVDCAGCGIDTEVNYDRSGPPPVRAFAFCVVCVPRVDNGHKSE